MRYLLIEAGFLLLIAAVCLLHWYWFKKNWKTGPLFHILFGAVYVVPLIWVGWFWNHSFILVLALCVERFFFYNPVLNLMRDKPFFYLSINSENPSWWDSIELKWESAYEYVWAASGLLLAGIIISQVIAM